MKTIKLPPCHPASEFFDMAAGEPIQLLEKAIKERGQLEPVVMIDGKILDGRRRWWACKAAGIEPKIVQWKDMPESKSWSPCMWVWDKNFNRRNLGVGDRAIAASRLKAYLEKNPSETMKPADAHRAARVSRSTAAAADKVVKNGTPALQEAVEKGKISVSDAAKVANKPKETQDKAVEAVVSRKAKTVAQAVKGEDKLKNGQILFDEKRIEDAMGKLIRAYMARWTAHGKIPKCPHYTKIDGLLNEVIKETESWRKKKLPTRS